MVGKDGLNLRLSGVEEDILLIKIGEKDVDEIEVLLRSEGRKLRDEDVSG